MIILFYYCHLEVKDNISIVHQNLIIETNDVNSNNFLLHCKVITTVRSEIFKAIDRFISIRIIERRRNKTLRAIGTYDQK